MMVYCPDIESPIERHQRACEQQHEPLFGCFDMLPDGHVLEAAEDDYHEHTRPQHTMGKDLNRIYMLEQLPINREEAPDEVAKKTIEKTFFVHL